MEREGIPPKTPIAGLAGTTARIVACKVVSGLALVGIAALTARQLGPSGRGVLVLMITLTSFAFPVCSLGVNIGGRVHLVAPRNPVPLAEYVGLCLVLALLDLAVCTALGSVLLPLAKVDLPYLDLLLFGLMGSAFLLQKLLNDGLVAYGLPVEAALIESGSLAARLATVGSLVLIGSADVRPYVLAFTITDFVQALAALGRLRRVQAATPRYHLPHWARLIRTGLPGVGYTMSQILTFRGDRYLLGIFASPAAVGIYSVAATAPEFIRLLPMALSQSVFHRLASGAAAVRDFRKARALCVLLTLGLIAVAFPVAPLAVHIVFGPEFASAVLPLRILLLAEIGMALFSLDGAALMGRGRVSDMALAATLGLVLVSAADLLLIPTYGLPGAAWASVFAYSIMGAASVFLLDRHTRRFQGENIEPNKEF